MHFCGFCKQQEEEKRTRIDPPEAEMQKAKEQKQNQIVGTLPIEEKEGCSGSEAMGCFGSPKSSLGATHLQQLNQECMNGLET
ncbi:unnamed protein product [Linum trigynum]|uniref:Uncharacterized protein n=1 Tax=Linum trigynum TaxID=586398 RepID=A0AAV2F8B3_9ROSI